MHSLIFGFTVCGLAGLAFALAYTFFQLAAFALYKAAGGRRGFTAYMKKYY